MEHRIPLGLGNRSWPVWYILERGRSNRRYNSEHDPASPSHVPGERRYTNIVTRVAPGGRILVLAVRESGKLISERKDLGSMPRHLACLNGA